MQISEILRENRVNPRPSYYSGRGATLSDLNSEILIGIQILIRQYHGEEAAIAFLNMVQSMTELNATDFINNCFMLEDNGYKWAVKTADKNGFDFIRTDDGHDEVHAAVSMFSAMSRGKRDDTEEIKRRFLGRNGIRLEWRNTYH